MSDLPVVAPGAVTLSDWLTRASRRLADSGVASPRHDAERLAACGLGVRWGDLWGRARDELSSDDVSGLERLVDRRSAHEPLAYVIGTTGFFGLELACGPGVLVPRPETETTVEVAVELLTRDADPVVVDVGTGTGAIALAIGAQRPDAEVWATETSPTAAGYAAENARRTSIPIRVVVGDLFAPLPRELRGRVALVVSDPPYVAPEHRHLLGPDVDAEPPEALFAPDRGDAVLQRIAAEAPAWLRPDGAMALEVGTPEQAERIRGLLEGWTDTGVRPDPTGRPRVVWARR